MANSGLIDQFGQPITRAQMRLLAEETAFVSAVDARPPFEGHVAWGLNPERLGAIVRAADNGSSLDWFRLAEEMEEICPHYAAVLNKRKRQVISLPIKVEAADTGAPEALKDAEMVERWLKTQTLQVGMFDVLDAIGKGFSVNEMIWAQQPPQGGQPGYCWPEQLIYDPQRFFEFSFWDGKTLWLRSAEGFQPLPQHKFIVHKHPSKSGNLVRSSLARQVAFLLCYALYNQRDWALFVQAYGLPIRLGKYASGASVDDKAALRRAVFSIAGDVAAIIPDSMQMEFVTTPDKAAGASLYEKRADWINREISKLVLGSTAGTDAINGGHAVGREHRQVEDDVEKFDAALLGFTLNRQVLPTMTAFCHGPRPGYPTLAIGRPSEIPLAELIDAVSDWGPLGLTVKADELRDRLQMTRPEAGDDVIGGKPPDPVQRPDIPRPVVKAPIAGDMARRGGMPLLAALAREVKPNMVEQLSARLDTEAAGALHGLTDEIKAVFMQARDLNDLKRRLKHLKLDADQYGEVMSRGFALAHLIGQAEILRDLGDMQ
ncbi:MAG TPA: DUF935 family protein [Gammaproteobacteria bacterium]|nr:DUF935 family protein [Gammaproteobacteria bacterium]